MIEPNFFSCDQRLPLIRWSAWRVPIGRAQMSCDFGSFVDDQNITCYYLLVIEGLDIYRIEVLTRISDLSSSLTLGISNQLY